MNRTCRIPVLASVWMICLMSLLAPAQSGPDVTVGELHNVASYGSVGGVAAFAVGTTSCNLGNVPLSWVSNTNQHPVIGQNMYRISNGRIEMIGMSWLKHGFLALSGSVCQPCTGPGGSQLDPGCSDPYGASLNGSQSGLGPRSEVNAATGGYPYPFTSVSTPGTIGRRVQVHESDLGIAGAQYIVEGHYITPDDAAAGNDDNNASYRFVNLNGNPGNYSISLSGGTQREKPAILAWADTDPDVEIMYVDVPNDGRFILAWKATQNAAGTYHSEFALLNLNSHRSGQSFTANTGGSSSFSGLGFKDVDYHSGDGDNMGTNYSGTDWSTSSTSNSASWATTFSSNANALRWGTMYSFWFDSSQVPTSVDIGLYRAGSPVSMNVPLPNPFPAFTIGFPNGIPSSIPADTASDVDISTSTITGSPDPGSATLHVSTDGGSYVTSSITHLGGNSYRATLPSTPCFSTLNWYVSISQSGGGVTLTSPSDAPSSTHSCDVGTVIVSDDFETNQGWTVVDDPSLSTGTWERGIPVGGGARGDPATDSDGSGQCYVTDNQSGNWDVDGGATYLTSPAYDLTGLSAARFSFDFWFDMAWGGYPQDDVFDIELSDDDGANWVLVESYNSNTGQWVHRDLVVGDHVALTSQVRIRLTASDFGSGTVVEAGLDAFRIIGCPDAASLGACADGNVGASSGGPYDVLFVNGSAGGASHRVDIGTGQPISFAVSQPPVTASAAGFVLFGTFGQPTAADVTTLPFGLGEACFMFCPLNPQDPTLFTLTDSIGATNCPQFLGSTPAPWSFTYAPGLSFETIFAVQGLIADPTGAFGLGVTNGVLVKITP